MNIPSPEARIAAQEELTALLHAQIKQLSLDMRTNFSETTQHMQLGFKQAHAYIQEHIEPTMATKEDLHQLEERIKKHMATKEDIRRLEASITGIRAAQDKILQLLQQRPGE